MKAPGIRNIGIAQVTVFLLLASSSTLSRAADPGVEAWHCALLAPTGPQEETYSVVGTTMHDVSAERLTKSALGQPLEFAYQVLENDADALVAVQHYAGVDSAGHYSIEAENILIDKRSGSFVSAWISIPATNALPDERGTCER